MHSDESGVASTQVTATATGVSSITAMLAPASYTPPQSKQATLVGTESSLDLGAVEPTKWVGQGATIDVPVTVRVLNMGGAAAGQRHDQLPVSKGVATLSSVEAMTDTTGYASTTVHLINHAADVQGDRVRRS